MVNERDFYDHIRTQNPIGKFVLKKYLSIFDEFVTESSPRKIIDIGCGKGALTNRVCLLIEEPSILGIDFDKSNLSLAKSNYSLEFLNADGYNLPFKDNSFDLAICTETLEHLKEPLEFLDELKRVSGEAILSVPNEPYWSLKNLVRGKYIMNGGCTPNHINRWTKTGFENLLNEPYDKVDVKSAYLWNLASCS